MTGAQTATERRSSSRWAALGGSAVFTGRLFVVALTLLGTAMAVTFSFFVVGLYALPTFVRLHRSQLDGIARAHARYTGTVIPVPDVPELTTRRWLPMLRWTGATFTRRETWRLLAWVLWDSTVGILLVAVPIGFIVWGIEGLLLLPGQYLLFQDPPLEWYTFIHATSAAALPYCAAMGAFLVAFSLFTAPWWLRLHGRMAGWALGHDQNALTARIDELTASRNEARRDAASELRRIEQQVHDGTQSGLVAIGMKLGTAEMLLDTDPDSARALIAQAKQDSSATLAELRDLMRGIRPPVLADRGLGAALEALSLDTATAVVCRIDISERHDADLESVAYFAARELIANAIKHADATTITLEAADTPASLVVTVTDDGVGGGVVVPGHGLEGMRRRLGIYDGTLVVTSPVGGPTSVRLELPCGS